MLFYSYRIRSLRKLKRNFNYYKVLFRSGKIKDTGKIIYVDVSNIVLNRYLYSFLKFFQIEGYTVYLPKSKKIIDILGKNKGEFEFASWLLEEGIVKFGKPKNKKITLFINAHQLSNDYFAGILKKSHLGKTYHIPMCEYPYLYHVACWNISININKDRKRSLFMIGNIDKRYYQDIGHSKLFNLPGRYNTFEYLYKKDFYHDLNSVKELDDFISGENDSKVLMIDTSKQFQLGGIELKQALSSFHYYLALPGIEIPLSHNLVEAMSVGCIPVIHKNYADIMRPKLLDEQNSFIFNNLEDLDFLIKRLFTLKEADLGRMRKEVLKYYNEFLIPASVVRKIEENNFDKIYIQAERISLSYLTNESNVYES